MASPYEAELAALATGESIHALATYCETFELDLKHVDLSADVSLSIYKVHLAAYLLCNQLENARFLWKRVEPSMRDADPEFCALWAVGKAMWAKDHAATQSAITGFSWSPPLMGTLMERLQREHLKRCFDDSVAVYSMVSASSLSATLGTLLITILTRVVSRAPLAEHVCAPSRLVLPAQACLLRGFTSSPTQRGGRPMLNRARMCRARLSSSSRDLNSRKCSRG